MLSRIEEEQVVNINGQNFLRSDIDSKDAPPVVNRRKLNEDNLSFLIDHDSQRGFDVFSGEMGVMGEHQATDPTQDYATESMFNDINVGKC